MVQHAPEVMLMQLWPPERAQTRITERAVHYSGRSNVAVVVFEHKHGYFTTCLQGCITYMWQKALNVLQGLTPANGPETFVAGFCVIYYTNPMLV